MATKTHEQPRVAATGRMMRVKHSGWFWNEDVEELFFDHLAANGNVTAAADAAGFCTPTVYRMRRRRPDFAARWQVALEQGYARLEIALLEAANDSLADRPFDEERPIPKMTVEQAMNVLRAHRNAIAGKGRDGPGRSLRTRTLDEVRASIERKVRAIRLKGEATSDPTAAREGEEEYPSRLREGLGEGLSAGGDAAGTGPPPTPPASGRGEEGFPSRLREGLGEGVSSEGDVAGTGPPPAPPASGRGEKDAAG
jgi:hypothetical protein